MIGVCIGGKKSRLDFEASANASAELLAAHSGLTFSHGWNDPNSWHLSN
jgi:hypothetical protein